MKFIGLLMVAEEDDILERTLKHNAQFVDCFYALSAGGYVMETPEAVGKCHGWWHDADVRYEGQPRDGWRQHLLERAYRDHGHDNWFLLLHGDEHQP